MSQKTKGYFFSKLIYSKLITNSKITIQSKINSYQTLYTFNFSKKNELKSTGFFFKKLAFMALAINIISCKTYYTTTLKSTVLSLWNKIAAYTTIL